MGHESWLQITLSKLKLGLYAHVRVSMARGKIQIISENENRVIAY